MLVYIVQFVKTDCSPSYNFCMINYTVSIISLLTVFLFAFVAKNTFILNNVIIFVIVYTIKYRPLHCEFTLQTCKLLAIKFILYQKDYWLWDY